MEKLFVALFPILFMLHELEEIIMLHPWLHKHRDTLGQKYPRIGKKIYSLSEWPAPAFALAVLEEFIIVSVCTTVALATPFLTAWLCCFLAFGVHLIVHLVQFICLKRYIPAILTTFLGLPYCIWAFLQSAKLYTWAEMVFWATVGSILCVLNLSLVHALTPKLWRRISR